MYQIHWGSLSKRMQNTCALERLLFTSREMDLACSVCSLYFSLWSSYLSDKHNILIQSNYQ